MQTLSFQIQIGQKKYLEPVFLPNELRGVELQMLNRR